MEREPETQTSRRRLLKQAALGAGMAGVAWSAPAVTSMAAAGPAGTCFCAPVGVNLLAAPFGNLVQVTTGGPRLVNGSNLTFTRTSGNTITNTTCAPTTWITGRVTNCTAGNISAGQIPIVRTGAGNPQTVSMTINFSPAVQELAFTLTDIDSSTGPGVQYWESVVISWTNAVGTSVPTYVAGSNLVNSAPNTYRCVNGTFNAAFNNTTCNLGVDFGCGGTISSLTIRSNDLNTTIGTSSTQGRMIGLAQLAFCTPP